MRTVSSCPGAGMMGSLHTEHLGANFLKKEDTRTVVPSLYDRAGLTQVASEIERSTGLFFLPSVGHHMTFCLIRYVLVLYSAAAHEKWWSLLPGRWASIGTLSLWWVIICCFGSKPTGINSLAAVSPHKKKRNLYQQNLLLFNESWGHGLHSNRGQMLMADIRTQGDQRPFSSEMPKKDWLCHPVCHTNHPRIN